MKDYDKEIEEFEARRRMVGRKLIPLKEGTYRRKLVLKALQLDQKIGRLRAERQSEIERLEKEKKRLEIEQQERLSARVKPAEIERVQVLRRYRMVKVYGSTYSKIRPHFDEMKYHLEFKILNIRPGLSGGYILTFGDDEGLDKYLEFTGWQGLPDES